MKDKTLNKLWQYQDVNNLTNSELARQLKVQEIYIYRWKKGKIGKMSLRIIEDFLTKR